MMINPILDISNEIMTHSRHVMINDNAIGQYCTSRPILRHWTQATIVPIGAMPQSEKRPYLLLFNAISFSYWGEPKWTIEHEGKEYDGAKAMLISLYREMERTPSFMSPTTWKALTPEQLDTVLAGTVTIPMLKERCDIINQLGDILCSHHHGSIFEWIAKSPYDAVSLALYITDSFPSFKDEFLKRAQLLSADICTLVDEAFVGIETLTACADYKLPQVLRREGIISYGSTLSGIIDRKIEIPAESVMEREIRAATICAVQSMVKCYARQGRSVSAMDINNQLWLEGQVKSSTDKPYHRTRTINY